MKNETMYLISLYHQYVWQHILYILWDSTNRETIYIKLNDKLVDWQVCVWRVFYAAHFLSVYFVIYLFILSSSWTFSCCSCPMRCKFCAFACTNQEGLFKHYRLRHGGGANWPCIYRDCVCIFRTHGALKTHLTRLNKHVLLN